MAKPIPPEHARYEGRYRAVYEAGLPRAIANDRLDHVRAFLSRQTKGGRLIDLGCGEGRAAALAASLGFDVLALDSAPSAIDRARETHEPHYATLRFELADVCDLDDLSDASFDLALDIGCLHMLVDDAEARRYLAHTFRLLRPGGFLFHQVLAPADDALAWCPWEAELAAWWRERLAEPETGEPVTEIYQHEGREIRVVRPSTPAARRDVQQQVALLTGAGLEVLSARVIPRGANSPFEVIIIARKPTSEEKKEETP